VTHLLLTVRFLDNRYHGLLDRGGPVEWPPSPFRLFQALVAGVARRGELVVGEDVPSNNTFTPIGQALDWLQKHTRKHPPIIIAPQAKPGQAITQFVPNNDSDKKFDRQKRLTAKHIQPTLFLLEPDQKPEVNYAWPLNGVKGCPVMEIEKAARSLTTLGWGIDMAFGYARLVAEAELETLKGVRWYPRHRDYPFKYTLRVPTYDALGECTLRDLRHCHSTFINRIEHGKPLKTVDKPKVFDRVLYTSTERPQSRPYAIFKLVDENEDTVSYPQAKLIHIAGMVKHLAIELMKKYPPRDLRGNSHEQWVKQYVAGHFTDNRDPDAPPHPRFSYVPLPSIGHRHTNPAVRRVMIIAPIGDEDWLEYLAQRLNGEILRPDPKYPDVRLPHPTLLQRIPSRKKDGVRDAYIRESYEWASVTPIILNRHVDKIKKTLPDGKVIEVLDRIEITEQIRISLAQSGIEQPCEFEWGAFSYFPKMLSAHKYQKNSNDPSKRVEIGYLRPDHLVGRTAVHINIRFGRRENPNDPNSRWIPADYPVPGPITIGAGRHCGLGLLARVDQSSKLSME
jgi:CRISPR-associated protein Csb2